MPRAADEPTSIARVDVAEPPEGGVTDVGSRVAVMPVGAPETDRPTAPLKPLIEAIVMVEVPELP